MKEAEVFLSCLNERLRIKGITRAALGEASGIEPTTISSWFRAGKVPGFRTLERLAKALGCEVADLVTNRQRGEAEARSSVKQGGEVIISGVGVKEDYVRADAPWKVTAMMQPSTDWHERQADQSLAEMRIRMIQMPGATPKVRGILRAQMISRIDEFISLCESEPKAHH